MVLKKRNHISCLYVEDEQDAREELSSILSRTFTKLLVASDGKEGLDIFLQKKPDLVITDIRMPVMDGLKMVKNIFKVAPDTMVIVTTAHSDTQFLIDAIETGVHHYVLKPIELEKLYTAIDKSIEMIVVRNALEEERSRKDELIQELSIALNEIKTLRGILPICSNCKKIRNDEGYFEQIEAYFERHLDVDFSHTICTTCMKKLYPEEYANMEKEDKDLKEPK